MGSFFKIRLALVCPTPLGEYQSEEFALLMIYLNHLFLHDKNFGSIVSLFYVILIFIGFNPFFYRGIIDLSWHAFNVPLFAFEK